MRKQPEIPARAPITEPYQLSRWLNKLTQGDSTLEFNSTLEYPTAGSNVDPDRPWDEILEIEITADDDVDVEDDEVHFEGLKLTVTSYDDGDFEWRLEVERYNSETMEYEGTVLEDAAERVLRAIWPLKKAKACAGQPAKAQVLPHIKLVQQSLTNGPQTNWLSYLDITKFDSRNELVSFQVACAMVGFAVHVADIDHFLKAIGFESHVLGVAKHIRTTRVVSELKERLKGKANLQGTGQLKDDRGIKYITFIVELNDETGCVFGMIDIRPEDELRADEEFDD